MKTAISEGSNGHPKSCLGAKQQKIVSTPVNSSFTAKNWDARGSE